MDTTCYQEAHIAKSFITTTYDCWKDGKKDELQKYYNENSKLNWNGIIFKGIDIMKHYYNIYQRFTITSIDCQPIDKEHLLINVTGLVIYDGEAKTAKLYSHQVVLESKPNSGSTIGVCVVLENFRWLAPCSVRAEQEDMITEKPKRPHRTPQKNYQNSYPKKNFYSPGGGRGQNFQNNM